MISQKQVQDYYNFYFESKKDADEEANAKKAQMMTPNMKAAQDVKRMAAGGRARKRPIDGIATKGKTRALY